MSLDELIGGIRNARSNPGLDVILTREQVDAVMGVLTAAREHNQTVTDGCRVCEAIHHLEVSPSNAESWQARIMGGSTAYVALDHVTHMYGSDTDIVAVFTTREGAEEAASELQRREDDRPRHPGGDLHDYRVHECDLDPPLTARAYNR